MAQATHPLLIELEQLLRDLGGAGGLAQARDAQLGDDILQHFLQRQAPRGAVPGGGGDGVF